MRPELTALVLASAVGCWGCAQIDAPIWLPLDQRFELAIVLTRDAGGASAFAVRSDQVDSLSIDRNAEVVALFYEQSQPLSVPIASGPLTIATDGYPLPAADQHLALDAAAKGWNELDAPPSWVSEIAIFIPIPCSRLTDRTLATFETGPSGPGFPRFLVPIDEDRFLMFVARLGELREISKNGVRVITPDGVGPNDDFIAGTFSEATREVFLIKSDGAVLRGHPDTGFASAPPLTFTSTAPWRSQATASPPDEDLEIFVMHAEDGLFHFDGQRWTHEVEPRPVAKREDLARVEWVAPNSAVVAGLVEDSVTLFSNGRANHETLIVGAEQESDAIRELVVFDGLGWFAATQEAKLFRFEDDRWQRLAETRLVKGIEQIGRIDRHLFFGGRNGEYVEYYFDLDVSCPRVTVGVGRAREIHSFADGSLLILEEPDQDGAFPGLVRLVTIERDE